MGAQRQRRASDPPRQSGRGLEGVGVASQSGGRSAEMGVVTCNMGVASGITDRSLEKGRGQDRKSGGVVTCGPAAEEGAAAAAAVRGAAGPLRSRGAMRRP